jgi:hypothetical protein
MIKKISLSLLVVFVTFGFVDLLKSNNPKSDNTESKNDIISIDNIVPSRQVKVEILDAITSNKYNFIEDHSIFMDGWDTLAQVRFWKQIMVLDKEVGLFNVAETRQILTRVDMKWWNKLSDARKETVKDSLRTAFGLESTTNLYLTAGKNHFYNFTTVMPHIHKALEIFEQEQTDPFYAQAILLIESPSKVMKSNVGAYGSFQIMPGVAKNMGLKVNNVVDERLDFDKSAWAAAKLLRTICIPEANKILLNSKIVPEPQELWYKLLVLHIYHAGAGNVSKAVAAMGLENGGRDFITQLWKTKAGAFGNASQNYSQVALASLLLLDESIYNTCSESNYCPYPNVFMVKE